MRRLVLALVVPLLALAACGDDDDVVDDGGGGTAEDDGLLVSIELPGSSTFGPGHHLGAPPRVTVYNDGTVITGGDVPAIYPGPAAMPLMMGEFPADEVDRIRARAGEVGLDDEDLAFEDPQVTHEPSLVVTVGVGEAEVATAVYAHEESFDAGLPLATQELRHAIREFVEDVETAATEAVTGEIYQPDRYRVAALADIDADDPDIEPGRAEWPFESMPEVDDCTVIVDDDARTLTEALAGATHITIWTTDAGDEFQLDVRPVLPHEPDCPA